MKKKEENFHSEIRYINAFYMVVEKVECTLKFLLCCCETSRSYSVFTKKKKALIYLKGLYI